MSGIRTRRLAIGAATAVALLVTSATAAPVAAHRSRCTGDFTPIFDIQGSGGDSPLAGQEVTTEGVVTVDLQMTSELSGFFSRTLTVTTIPATSDGIFLSHSDASTPSFGPSPGDIVRVTGTVDERFGNTQIESLESGEFCGNGRVRPQRLDTHAFNENPEQYEGMYVRFPGALSVTDTFNLHRFGEVWLASDGVVEQPTNEFPGGTPEADALAAENIEHSILLDDGSGMSNPNPVPHLSGDTLRLGDRKRNLKGAVQFNFGQYRVHQQVNVPFKAKNRRPAAPRVKGNLTVASFNVLNYWTTLGGRGAGTPEQLAVQTEKLVAAINGMGADVVGLQEVENDVNCGDPNTSCSHTPTETLVAALNADLGAELWSWVGPVDHYNYYPIRNEIIYRNDRVNAVGDPMALANPAFDTFRDKETPPLKNTSQLGRPPIAQTFEHKGEVFTVMVNHFKSKGSNCDVLGDPDVGDGQGNCNLTRIAQAEAVLDWTKALVESTGDPDVLVLGDLNAYFREDPVLTLETGLENIVDHYVHDPYSFNFFATFAFPFVGRGTLDHALTTPSLADQVKTVKIWHINADEPRFLDWFDPSRVAPGPYRSSDHDPVLIGLKLHNHDKH